MMCSSPLLLFFLEIWRALCSSSGDVTGSRGASGPSPERNAAAAAAAASAVVSAAAAAAAAASAVVSAACP